MANPSRTVLTPEFRLSYAHLISPKEFIEKGKPTGKFSYITDALIKLDDVKKFKIPNPDPNANGALMDVDFSLLLVELAKEAWGTEINPDTSVPYTVREMFAGVAQKGWPLKDGNKLADAAAAKQKDGEQYRGLKVISIKSNVSDKSQPPILSKATPQGKKVFNRNMPSDLEEAKSLFQSGNYCVAELNIVANVVGGMKYLTCYVNSIRYTREGVKFGRTGGAMLDKFGGTGGGVSERTDLQVDDEIPF